MTPNRSKENELQLFDPGPATPSEILTKTLDRPVWTENKADLIAKYLRYFVFITRHGTYIDAFAGPTECRYHTILDCQESPRQRTKVVAPTSIYSTNHLNKCNDCSNWPQRTSLGMCRFIKATRIRSFSRYSQWHRSVKRRPRFAYWISEPFQCEWQLCEHVSKLRPGTRKVEQFYFLANWWMSRALSGIKTPEGEEKARAWFGQDDWRTLGSLTSLERAEVFADKFKTELGYRSVKPWPIYRRDNATGGVMYYMIHATDHDEAPKLMYRAYCKAVDPPESVDQLSLALEGFRDWVDTGD